ncbi:MAG: outer membrane protein assembly factor BamB family protein [Planctomycetota bacterium]|jgi:outer membrane protein assembly factor BamB
MKESIGKPIIGTALIVICLAGAVMPATYAAGEDWPTYRHDNGRTAVTGETLKLRLHEVWKKTSAAVPQPAWEGPARWDAYHSAAGLKSMRNFDPVFHVTAQGTSVFYGSSVDDSVHCLDAATGKTKWLFSTDGPVRLPPTLYEGKVYFGSDDGWAYCLSADAGKLIWKHKPAETDRLIPSNGKLISTWPVRTGVLVADGKAYFAASLLPWRESYICAVDAETGSDQGEGLFKAKHANITLQGAMLAWRDRLYVVQGRSVPLAFSRADGRGLGGFGKGGRGGIFAILTREGKFAYGFGNRQGEIYVHDGNSRAELFKFPGAARMLIAPQLCYIHKGKHLEAGNFMRKKAGPAEVRELHRQYVNFQAAADSLAKALKAEKDPAKKAQLKVQFAEAQKKAEEARNRLRDAKAAMAAPQGWKTPMPVAYEMILAGNTLVVGGSDAVTVLDASTGKPLWRGRVEGKAHGLAVADGRLFVSTDLGNIYCFAAAGR